MLGGVGGNHGSNNGAASSMIDAAAVTHQTRLSAYSGQHIHLPDHLYPENLEKFKIKAVKANLRSSGSHHQAAAGGGASLLSRSKSLGRQEGRAVAAGRNALASVSGTIRGKALPR